MFISLAGMSGDGGVLAGVLHPPVLFFFLGMLAAAARSNLHIPKAVTKLLSLYLLWAIGFRGGVEISHGELGREAVLGLGAAVLLAMVVPAYTFFLLRRRLSLPNAAAIAATYGSISAVTFMAATSVLEARGIAYGGHMVAAMALMESPAIVVAVLLMRWYERKEANQVAGATPARGGWGLLFHEAFLNGPVLLLLGSLAIGIVTGDRGYQAFKPLVTDAFSGVLVFFLLDLGLLAARRLRSLKEAGPSLWGFAIVVPLVNAAAAIGLSYVLGLEIGNAFLLAVLTASASYIAVPAAMRLIVPQASPGLYIPMALGITFPLNIAVGIPLYLWVVERLWALA